MYGYGLTALRAFINPLAVTLYESKYIHSMWLTALLCHTHTHTHTRTHTHTHTSPHPLQGLKRSEQHAMVDLFKTKVVAASGEARPEGHGERGLIQPIKKLERLMRF